MVDSSAIKVAVVGAGVGGLAAASFLSRAGADVTVFEARAQHELTQVDYGVALHTNGLLVLDALGIAAPLADQGSNLSQMRLFDEYMNTVVEVDAPDFGLPEPTETRRWGPILVVSHREMHQRLQQAAVEAGAKIEYGQRLSAVSVDEDACPMVYLGGQSHRYDMVVGADGIESVTRRLLYDGDVKKSGRRKYARGLLKWSLLDNAAGQYWTRRGVAEMLPCGAETTYWFAAVTPQMQAAVDQSDIEQFRRAVASAHPPLLQTIKALHSLDDVDFGYSRTIELERFYEGEVVLIGDAAHPIEPTLAQGANTALLDAAVLGSEIFRRDHIPEALVAYQARRGDPINEVQRDARRLALVANFTHARRLRNVVVKMVPASVYRQAALRIAQNDLSALRRELRELVGSG